MPPGENVKPKRWSNVIYLYDDGGYSAIWGNYHDDDGSNDLCLGVRWNGGEGEYGYPKQGVYPLWYVEPHFVTRDILLSLLYRLAQNTSLQGCQGYQQNILVALSECQ